MTIDTPADVVALVVIASGILGGLLWIIRAQNAIQKQFQPNGGKSAKDALDRIERDTRDLRIRLDKHIDDHNR